jgi:hypothetical protein
MQWSLNKKGKEWLNLLLTYSKNIMLESKSDDTSVKLIDFGLARDDDPLKGQQHYIYAYIYVYNMYLYLCSTYSCIYIYIYIYIHIFIYKCGAFFRIRRIYVFFASDAPNIENCFLIFDNINHPFRPDDRVCWYTRVPGAWQSRLFHV